MRFLILLLAICLGQGHGAAQVQRRSFYGRGAAGIVFSVPRTPGAYGVTVFAKDNAGCFSVTTLARSVVVQ